MLSIAADVLDDAFDIVASHGHSEPPLVHRLRHSQNALASCSASSAVSPKKPWPRTSSGPRGQARIAQEHRGPPLADGLDVDPDPQGFIGGAEDDEKAGGCHEGVFQARAILLTPRLGKDSQNSTCLRIMNG